MSKVAKIRPDNPAGAIAGDVVYYSHPKHGACAGKVIASGKHGCTVEHEEGPQQVKWEGMLGIKERAQRKFTLLDQGEDGAIVEDEDGRRHYLRGDLPQDEEPEESEPERPWEDLAKSLAAEYRGIDLSPIVAAIEAQQQKIQSLELVLSAAKAAIEKMTSLLSTEPIGR